MSITVNIEDFRRVLAEWCEDASGVVAAAIVGSYARGEARPDSDIDVVILSERPGRLLQAHGWLTAFGNPTEADVEDWGPITSLRTSYSEWGEVEFGVGMPSWAAIPVDDGTRAVVSDGMVVVFDPAQLLAKLSACIGGPNGADP